MTRGLTKRQHNFLHGLRFYGRSAPNYAGTPADVREAVLKRGLVLHNDVSWSAGQRHLRWSRYTLTELGRDVLCAMAFDQGLAYGFNSYCADVDARRAADEREDELEMMRSFGTTEYAMREVRKALGVSLEAKS